MRARELEHPIPIEKAGAVARADPDSVALICDPTKSAKIRFTRWNLNLRATMPERTSLALALSAFRDRAEQVCQPRKLRPLSRLWVLGTSSSRGFHAGGTPYLSDQIPLTNWNFAEDGKIQTAALCLCIRARVELEQTMAWPYLRLIWHRAASLRRSKQVQVHNLRDGFLYRSPHAAMQYIKQSEWSCETRDSHGGESYVA